MTTPIKVEQESRPTNWRALAEEALAALYFIAAGIAFNAGWNVFGCLMLAKGVIDTLSAVASWLAIRSRIPENSIGAGRD